MQKALPSYTKQWEERDVIILNFGNPKPLIEDFQRENGTKASQNEFFA